MCNYCLACAQMLGYDLALVSGLALSFSGTVQIYRCCSIGALLTFGNLKGKKKIHLSCNDESRSIAWECRYLSPEQNF